MHKSIDRTRAILIGGSSHTGKSTLGQALAAKLGWSYLATDKLARHPGRPWVGINGQAIPAHVVEHYRDLSAEALLLDVLSHYTNNVVATSRGYRARSGHQPIYSGRSCP